MTLLKFVLPDGSRRQVEAVDGHSVMQTAVLNDIAGVVAECSGSMACATCHVFLDEASAGRLGPPSETESDMLDFTAVERRATSRLSCQIIVGDALAGATITIPEAQV